MRVGRLHMESIILAERIGARRTIPMSPFIEIILPAGVRRYWPVDPLVLVERGAA